MEGEIEMSKKICVIFNVWLIIWFFLDMVGFKIRNFILVESAWKDDGVFFLVYILLFVFFCLKEKQGKYPLTIFLSLWLVIQFFSHWYYTIFGASEKKLLSYNRYFANTYHVIPASDSLLVPDLYHVLLHLFILIALVFMAMFTLKLGRAEITATSQNNHIVKCMEED